MTKKLITAFLMILFSIPAWSQVSDGESREMTLSKFRQQITEGVEISRQKECLNALPPMTDSVIIADLIKKGRSLSCQRMDNLNKEFNLIFSEDSIKTLVLKSGEKALAKSLAKEILMASFRVTLENSKDILALARSALKSKDLQADEEAKLQSLIQANLKMESEQKELIAKFDELLKYFDGVRILRETAAQSPVGATRVSSGSQGVN